MGVFDVSHHPHLYCSMGVTSTWTANMCSTLFLLSMTFDRFFSIMKPHKAAAFNTTKRAKITIVVCVLFSLLYNSPHIFISSYQTGQCVPFEAGMKLLVGQIYYWLSYVLNFVLPFILLLSMNSFIIAMIHKSRLLNATFPTNQDQSHCKTKNLRNRHMLFYFLSRLVF